MYNKKAKKNTVNKAFLSATALSFLIIIISILLISLTSNLTNAYVKLEPIQNESIKLNSQDEHEFEIILDKDNYKTKEEILGWIIFRINKIPVASKDTLIEIIKDQQTIQNIRTSKTYFKTEINEPGIYTIKAQTQYKEKTIVVTKKLIVYEQTQDKKTVEVNNSQYIDWSNLINKSLIKIDLEDTIELDLSKIQQTKNTTNTTIKGNLIINKKYLQKEIYPLLVNIFIYQKESDEFTYCPVTINEGYNIESKEIKENSTLDQYLDIQPFSCNLKGSIQIGKYVIETSTNIMKEKDVFNSRKEFEITIKKSENIEIKTKIESENKTFSLVNINTNIINHNNNLEIPNIIITTIDPENITSNKIYNTNKFNHSFIAQKQGIYTLEIQATSNNDYTKKVLKINVTKNQNTFNIIPTQNPNFNKNGELNFNIELPNIYREKITNLTLHIKSLEDKNNFSCKYEIEPKEYNFTLNCPAKNYLTIGNYQVKGTFVLNEQNITSTSTFRLKIDNAKITLLTKNLYQNTKNKLNIQLDDTKINLDNIKVYASLISKNKEDTKEIIFENIQDNIFGSEVFLTKDSYEMQITAVNNNTVITTLINLSLKKNTNKVIQEHAKIGEDVKWIITDTAQEINIPLIARNIAYKNQNGEIINTKIKTTINNFSIEELKQIINETLNLQKELAPQVTSKNNNPVIRLASFITKSSKENKLQELKNKINNLNIEDKIQQNLRLNEILTTNATIQKTNDTKTIEYYTPAPTKTEKIITKNKKQVIIASELHYHNITTHTNIPETQEDKIKLYWYENSNKRDVTNDPEVNPRFMDINNNGLIDQIIWNTPHTSTQVFEIEIITPENLKVNKEKVIDNKLWLVEISTNETQHLTLKNQRGLFASDISCTNLEDYESSINNTQLENIYQSLENNSENNIQENLSKYNQAINETFKNWNCTTATIIYTIQIPKTFNGTETVLKYGQETKLIYPGVNNNLIIIPEYNLQQLENTSIKKVNITIKSEYNNTAINPESLNIKLHTLNNKTIERQITDITSEYILTLDKTSNLYNKIEIIGEYNNSKIIKTILIKPNITQNFNYNENIEFLVNDIQSAIVLDSNNQKTNFSIDITSEKITLTPIKNSLKPGLYQLIINHSDYTETIWFKFGLIAFNTHKPIYHNNETANIEFIVLDNNGFIVNDAYIEFEVLRPDGFKEIFTTNNFIKVNNDGVYHLDYYLENLGKYTLNAKATTNDGTTQLTRFIYAVENYDFDILRESKITIDPNLENITTVFSFNSYLENPPESFKFVEKVPLSFEIINSSGAKITTDDKFKYLTWENVKITDKLNYTAKTPTKTPYLYQLGRSQIEYGSLFNKKTFIENQTKLLAIDPVAQGNAYIMWGWGEDSIRYVRYRTFNPATNSFGSTQSDIPFTDIANNNPIWIESENHPFESEVAITWITENQNAYAAIWNGTNWGNFITLTTSTGTLYKPIDLAYEQKTGNLLVFYGDNTNIPKYRTWDGTSWSAQNSANNIGSTPRFIRAESKPNINSNEIMLVISDAASDINTQTWNGTSFSAVTELTTNNFNDRHGFDITYETISNDAIVIYRHDTSSNFYYNIYSAGSWGARQSQGGIDAQPRLMQIKADPNSNRIIAGVVDDSSQNFHGFVRDGGAWTNLGRFTWSVNTEDTIPFDLDFESQSGDAMFAYAEGSNIQYRILPSGSTSIGGEQSIGGYGWTVSQVKLTRAQFSDHLYLGAATYWYDVGFGIWDGTSWSNTGLAVSGSPSDTSKRYYRLLENVEYFTQRAPTANLYGLNVTSGTNLRRNNNIEAYSYWSDAERNLTYPGYITHNGNSTNTEYEGITTGKWLNYTLNLSNTTEFNKVGRIDVQNIRAKDLGPYGETGYVGWIFLYDEANLTSENINKNTFNQSETILYSCQAYDKDLSKAIENYNILYYLNNTYIGNARTNNSGWATLEHHINEPGSYQINCTINDNGYYIHNPTENNFAQIITIIDSTKPEINLITPLNDTQFVDETLNYSFTVNDEHSQIENCSLLINNSIADSSFSISELGINNITHTLGNGLYNWKIKCYDDSSNNNFAESETRIIRIAPDTAPPIITLLEPPNTADTLANTIVKFQVYDELSGIDSCTLRLDGLENETVTSINNNDIVEIPLNGLTSGLHTWRVNCSDNSPQNNWILSDIWSFRVGSDQTPPDITIISPLADHIETDDYIEFIFEVNDYMSNVENCSLYLNGTLQQTNTTINESRTQIFTITPIAENKYNYQIECYDTSMYQNSRITTPIEFIVEYDYDSPIINLVEPENTYQSTTGNLDFIFNVDDKNEIENCSLRINDTIQTTNSNINKNENITFSLTGLTENKYNWDIICYDDSDSNNLGISIKRNFSVGPDTIAPEITLIGPSNNSIVTNENVLFTYIVNDITSGIDTCEVFVNGSIVDSSSNVQENNLQFLEGTLTDGRYEWYITCTDDSPQSNLVQSNTQYFDVNQNYETSYEINLHSNYIAQGEIINPQTKLTDSFSNNLFNADTHAYIVRNLGTDNHTLPWYDSNWQRRVELPITNNNAQSSVNPIIAITLNTQDLINAGLLNADCSDLRIVDQGNNNLNYYFYNEDRGCNNANTDILVQTNNLWANTNHRIGAYFNNPTQNTDTQIHNNYLIADTFDKENTFTSSYWSQGSTTPGGVSISNVDNFDGSNSARMFVDCSGTYCDYALETASFEKNIIVTEQSTLTWTWRRATTSSTLRLYLNGNLITSTTSGTWTTATTTIPAGTHSVKWELRTTGTGVGSQTSYVDQIYLNADNIVQGTTTTQAEPVEYLGTQKTNFQGESTFTWDTSTFPQGTYSVTGHNKQTNYWSDFGNFSFYLGPDIEAPEYNEWGLNVSNGASVLRGQKVLAYSLWYDKVNLSSALTSHNGTGTFTNYSTTIQTQRESYANYTLDTANLIEFSEIGRIEVNGIYATDAAGNTNKTSPPKYFNLFSKSRLNTISINKTQLDENEKFQIECSIEDIYTNNPIQNYEITFIYNSITLGQNTTNAAGTAQFVTDAILPGQNIPIYCEIEDKPNIFYYKDSPNSISELINVSDSTPPAITLITLENNTLQKTPIHSLSFSAYDSGELDTCELYGNWNGGWHKNQTKTTLDNGNFPILNYFNPIQFEQGSFKWYVTCNDTGGNIGYSVNFTFNVSLSKPVVTLTYPSFNQTLAAGPQQFNFTVTQPDTEIGIEDCTLFIDNIFEAFMPGPITKGVEQTFISSYIDFGEHNWSVLCNANNTLSDRKNSTIQIIELEVNTPHEIIDRDEINPSIQDNILLRSNERSKRENLNVTFYANLTNPNIPGNTRINLGTNKTNTNGTAVINFNPNSSWYAGNYTWWTEFSNYTGTPSINESTFTILGGLNINFENALTQPSNHHYANEELEINATISSLGIETLNNLKTYYDINLSFNLTAPDTIITNYPLTMSTDWYSNIPVISLSKHGLWNISLLLELNNYFILNQTNYKESFFNFTGFGIPQIQRIRPLNNFATANTNIDFEWSVTDSIENNIWCNLTIDNNINISNIALTNNTPITRTISGFTEGQHNWSLTCFDIANNINSTNTWNFTLDLTPPQIEFVNPTRPTNIVTTNNWTFVNVTINELNLDTVLLEWNFINETLSCTGTSPNYYCQINKTNIADGNHSYTVYVNDSLGNKNKTETRYIGIDTTNPLVVYNNVMLPNATATNNNWIYVRINVTDLYPDTAILEWNGINETMTCVGTGMNHFCYLNKTTLADGTYTFKTYINDTMSHENQTEFRTNYVDTTNPLIQFINPTPINNKLITINKTLINVSITETSPDTIYINWNGTNELLTCVGTSPNYYCYINKTNLISGTYNYQVFVNDTLGNTNNTELRTLKIETRIPTLKDFRIQATSSGNLTQDNLTCYFEHNASTVTTAIQWYKNNLPIMQAYYPFEGNTSNALLDYSGNNNDLILKDNVAWNYSTGYDNNGSFYFDGTNDYLSIKNLHYDTAGQIEEITVCVWAKSSSSNQQILVSTDRSEYWRLSMNDDSTTNVAWDTADSAGTIDDLGTPSSYTDGQWHFICGWFDSNANPDKKIFIDGTQVTSTYAHAGNNLGTGVTRYGFIGTGSEAGSEDSTTGPDNFFEGYMDEVRIYNSALSDEQIQALYENKTNTIVSQETSAGDIWNCSAIPFSTIEKGIIYNSNNITILDNPKIQFVPITPENSDIVITDWIYINVTINDSVPQDVDLEWNGVNESLPCSGPDFNKICSINKTFLAEGIYSFKVYVNDTVGNKNSTETRTVTLNILESTLDIDLIYPTTDILVNQDDIFNVTLRVACHGTDCGEVNTTLAYKNSASNWWDPSFNKCQNIDITNTQATTLTNYPTYLLVPYDSDMNTNYNDLRFVNNSCGTTATELDYELEYYNSTHAVVWVEIDQLPNAGKTISMYYDNPMATSGQNPTGTWNSNHAIVYHMRNNLQDSTSNNRHAISTVGTPTQSTSNLGYDSYFDGNDAWSQQNMNYWESQFDQRTHEIIFTTSADTTTRQVLFAEGGNVNGIMLYIVSGDLYARWWSESDGWNGDQISTPINPNTQYHAVMKLKEGTGTDSYSLIVNGNLIDERNTPTGISAHSGDGGIAYTGANNKDFHDGNYGPGEYFEGTITEFRAYDNTYTKDWFDQTYELITNQDTLVHFGMENAYGRTKVSETTGDTPLYVTNKNPFNVTILDGDINLFNIYVNATGAIDSTWELFVDTMLSYFGVILNETETFNVTIKDLKSPKIFFNSPTPNNTIIQNNWTYINFTVIEKNIANITFEWNNTNQTPTCIKTGIKYDCEFNITNLPDGNYSFKAYANDTSSNTNSTTQRYVIIDTKAPLIEFIPSTPINNSNLSKSWIYINTSITELNPDTITLEFNNTNETLTCTGTTPNLICSINKTSIPDGTYNYTVYVNDTIGNKNKTKTRTINIDSTNPQIEFIVQTPIDNYISPNNWTTINISITENNLNTTTLEWNNTNETLTCTGTNPNYICTINKTNLIEGNYSYKAYVNDTFSNENQTESRNVIIDLTYPKINFTNPTPNNHDATIHNWTFINVTITEKYFKNATLNWNGTNESLTCTGTTPDYYCEINKTNLDRGNYSYQVCTYDLANHKNCTQTQYINLNQLFYIINLPTNNKVVLTENQSVDVTVEGQHGLRNITIQSLSGINISNFTVDFYKDHNWTNITAQTNITQAKSVIHVPVGHPEISNQKTLYIPVKIGLGAVYICPDATNLNEVNRACTNIYYRWNLTNESGFYRVNVTGTGGQEGSKTNLTIFDNTNDPEGENRIHIINEDVIFFANFTNLTNYPINDDHGVSCRIKFNITGTWTPQQFMTYNTSTTLWEYSRNFAQAGTYDYNISCRGISQAYENLNASDNFTINTTAIYFNNVQAIPNYAFPNTNINITANITSPVNLQNIWLNITGPTGNFDYLMQNLATDIYNYTFTQTGNYGIYNYSIFATDEFGNSVQSPTFNFEIVGHNSKIFLKTENDTYKKDEFVLLRNETSPDDWWDLSWTKRKPIQFTETRNVPRVNEFVELNITNLELNQSCDELRIATTWNNQNPSEVPYQLVDNGSDWCYVYFLANISANAVNEEYYHAYYDNPTAIAPTYVDKVQLQTYSGQADHRVEAEFYRVEFEPTNKLPVNFVGKAGTFQEDMIRGWTNTGCNGAGILTDTSSSWRDECNKAGVFTVLEDGPLKTVINTFKNAGGGLTTLNMINKTYTFYPTYWTVEVTVTGNSNNNEVSFIRINHNANTGTNPLQNFRFETSTGEDPDGIDCSGGHELTGGWSSDWASIYQPGTDLAYSYLMVSDPNSLINTFEYYEGATECGASSKQHMFVDNGETIGPVTIGFYPTGEQTDKDFSRQNLEMIRNPSLVTLGTQEEHENTYSVLANYGKLNISGELIMSVEYFNAATLIWEHIETILNDTNTATLRTLTAGEILNIGNLWNNNPWFTNQSPLGTYRARAYFVNSTTKNIIENQDTSLVQNTYEFEINYNRSSINQSYLRQSNIIEGQTAEMICQVINPDQLFPYENYEISFFINGTLFGTNITNTTGHASIFTSPVQGTYNLSCNITDDIINSIDAIPPVEGYDILHVWPPDSDITPPVITNVNHTPDFADISTTITIQATVTDNVRVNATKIFIRRPAQDTWISYNMSPMNINAVGNGTYEFNYTLTTVGGRYTYYIQAQDNWTTPNIATSNHYHFEITPINAIAKIKTQNTTYKSNELVYINNYSIYTTPNTAASETVQMQYVFFEDGFESSSTTGTTGFDNSIWSVVQGDGDDAQIVSAGDQYNGTYAARLRDGIPNVVSITTQPGLINLSQQTSCDINLARRINSFSSAVDDWANLDIYDTAWTNGLTSWGTIHNGGWQEQTISLDSAILNEDFRLRLRMTTLSDARQAFFDDISVTCENEDFSSNYIDYALNGNPTTNTAAINLIIQIDEYSNKGSHTTTKPDIQVGIWNGFVYDYNNFCRLDNLYGNDTNSNTNMNCTISISDPNIISAWENPANRLIKVRGTYLDSNNQGLDRITWNGIWSEFLTPSIIVNTGYKNITGNVLLAVYKNDTNELIQTIYNTTQTIAPKQIIEISSIWNSTPFNTQYNQPGKYYAFSAITDTSGNIMQNPDGTDMSDKSYFDIDYLFINVTSPIQNQTYYTNNVSLNITLISSIYQSGGWCVYALDNLSNQTLTQNSPTNFSAMLSNLEDGNHSVIVYCNDTFGDITRSENVTFKVEQKTTYTLGNNTIYLDRDEISPSINNSAILGIRVGDKKPNHNVSFYIQRNSPNLTNVPKEKILIGYNLTNISGITTISFNPNGSIYAGNYSWWGEIENGTIQDNKTLIILGGLNYNFTDSQTNPNSGYLKTQNIIISTTFSSYGVENTTQMLKDYNLTSKVNITKTDLTQITKNLTNNSNELYNNYLTTKDDPLGTWNITILPNMNYFITQNFTRNTTIFNNANVIGKLSFTEINSKNYSFKLNITNNLNITTNISAYVYIPDNFILNNINYPSTVEILNSPYNGTSREINLTLNEFESKLINYNVTRNLTKSQNMQEALMFGIDPK